MISWSFRRASHLCCNNLHTFALWRLPVLKTAAQSFIATQNLNHGQQHGTAAFAARHVTLRFQLLQSKGSLCYICTMRDVSGQTLAWRLGFSSTSELSAQLASQARRMQTGPCASIVYGSGFGIELSSYIPTRGLSPAQCQQACLSSLPRRSLPRRRQ